MVRRRIFDRVYDTYLPRIMMVSHTLSFLLFLFVVLFKIFIHAEVYEETENGIIFRDPLKGNRLCLYLDFNFVFVHEVCICSVIRGHPCLNRALVFFCRASFGK